LTPRLSSPHLGSMNAFFALTTKTITTTAIGGRCRMGLSA
jgi:hypothetical protein